MPSPCNNINVVPIKVSQLVRLSSLDETDYLLTIESGSGLFSRKSTLADLMNAFSNLTGSYSGSFVGNASGSFSGSYWGRIISKNTNATGSFNGNIVSLNTKATGSFYSTQSTLSGSFSGSHFGSVVSKNMKATGSFVSANTKATGSFNGIIVSTNTKATGSFYSTQSTLSGSFSGSYFGSVVSKNTKSTGSFFGVNNISNFKGTGKGVSFNGTSSYAVSSSYATTSSYVSGISGGFGQMGTNLYVTVTSDNTLNTYNGSYVSTTHTFGTTPSIVRATLLCITDDVGYISGDEVNLDSVEAFTGNVSGTLSNTWANSSEVGVALGWAGSPVLVPKTGVGVTRQAITTNRWKIKIRAWK